MADRVMPALWESRTTQSQTYLALQFSPLAAHTSQDARTPTPSDEQQAVHPDSSRQTHIPIV